MILGTYMPSRPWTPNQWKPHSQIGFESWEQITHVFTDDADYDVSSNPLYDWPFTDYCSTFVLIALRCMDLVLKMRLLRKVGN